MKIGQVVSLFKPRQLDNRQLRQVTFQKFSQFSEVFSIFRSFRYMIKLKKKTTTHWSYVTNRLLDQKCYLPIISLLCDVTWSVLLIIIVCKDAKLFSFIVSGFERKQENNHHGVMAACILITRLMVGILYILALTHMSPILKVMQCRKIHLNKWQ